MNEIIKKTLENLFPINESYCQYSNRINYLINHSWNSSCISKSSSLNEEQYMTGFFFLLNSLNCYLSVYFPCDSEVMFATQIYKGVDRGRRRRQQESSDSPFAQMYRPCKKWSPYGFFGVGVTEKGLITCPVSCCEDLQSSSSASVPLSFLCKVELPSAFPVIGLASSHKPFKNQCVCFFEKGLTEVPAPVCWSPQSSRRWKKRK